MARQLSLNIETWEAKFPVRIAGHVMGDQQLVAVTVSEGDVHGHGEAMGVFYRHDTAQNLAAAIVGVRAAIQDGVTRNELRTLLPPGGARNALDCALWDLESKLAQAPVWKLAGLAAPAALLTTFTVSADTPAQMAEVARTRYAQARAIKIKLLGDDDDAARVRAIRQARDDVWLGVDLNQGATPETLNRLMPVLEQARVAVIEQPFAIGDDHLLDDLWSVIDIAADESAQCLEDIDRLAGRYDVINIKLDKCGGLTEALLIAEKVRALGLKPMVGNMGGTSLAAAPALIVGQSCEIVDLDGPLFLADDRKCAVIYADGYVSAPQGLWGWAP